MNFSRPRIVGGLRKVKGKFVDTRVHPFVRPSISPSPPFSLHRNLFCPSLIKHKPGEIAREVRLLRENLLPASFVTSAVYRAADYRSLSSYTSESRRVIRQFTAFPCQVTGPPHPRLTPLSRGSERQGAGARGGKEKALTRGRAARRATTGGPVRGFLRTSSPSERPADSPDLTSVPPASARARRYFRHLR